MASKQTARRHKRPPAFYKTIICPLKPFCKKPARSATIRTISIGQNAQPIKANLIDQPFSVPTQEAKIPPAEPEQEGQKP